MTDHVVMFSGGVGSWCAGKRVQAAHPGEAVHWLFADTLIEDEDLYRFVDDVERELRWPIFRLADGRDPWSLFMQEGMIGNTRADLCSRVLKRELLDTALRQIFDPQNTIIYVGIDWTESHRFDDGRGGGAKGRFARAGWRSEAPLCEAPFLDKEDMLRELDRAGIKRPRLYDLGFSHNNCGGFCIKAGHASFARLLLHFPDRYRQHEEAEERFRATTGKDVAVMRDRRGGVTTPLTMRAFRERVERLGEKAYDKYDIGGCGCFNEPSLEDML